MAAGGVLRAVVAPHNHQFLPLFRVRLLLATGLLMALLLAAFYLVFLPAILNGEAPPVEAIVFVFGALTALFLAMFVITGDWNRMFIVLALLFALSLWLRLEGPLRLRDAGVSFAAVIGVAGACAWLVFAVWFLRVRRIRPPMLTPTLWYSRQLGPAEVLPHATARRTVMNGVIEASTAKMLLLVIGLGLVIGGAFALAAYLVKSQNGSQSLTIFVWPFVMMIVMAETTYRVVRQSRLLWLHVPGSRAEVLRVVETALVRRYLWIVAFNLAVAATVLVLQAPALREIGWALALSAALYGSYVGLATIRGFRLLILGCGPMAIVQIALLGTSGATTTELTAMLAAQLLGTLLFRLFAARRWHRIDWLRFRPLGNNIL